MSIGTYLEIQSQQILEGIILVVIISVYFLDKWWEVFPGTLSLSITCFQSPGKLPGKNGERSFLRRFCFGVKHLGSSGGK